MRRRSAGTTVRRGDRSRLQEPQATVLAPTGTIGFMMDCDTRRESGPRVVKFRSSSARVNEDRQQHGAGCSRQLGYTENQVRRSQVHRRDGTIEGAPFIHPEQLPSDCRFQAQRGTGPIPLHGTPADDGAVQPSFGRLSKNRQLPRNAHVDEIMEVYMQSENWGVKSDRHLPDNSKKIQR